MSERKSYSLIGYFYEDWLRGMEGEKGRKQMLVEDDSVRLIWDAHSAGGSFHLTETISLPLENDYCLQATKLAEQMKMEMRIEMKIKEVLARMKVSVCP